VVTLLTEREGKVGASFRHGRKSSRRAAGGVEPFHTLDVLLEDRGRELLALKESRLVTVREGVVRSLEAMDAAGAVLRWARHLLPARHADPAAWTTLVGLLDALDRQKAGPRSLQALAGLRLLASVGYALELGRCVVCGRPCPDGAPAFVDAGRGGLVCQRCGGARRRLEGRTRELAARAQRGEDDPRAGEEGLERLTVPGWLTPSEAGDLLGLVSEAMAAHADLDPAR
jgi:DNA repair protein RecO (recombination protein O)